MKYMYFKSWPVTLIDDAGNTSFFRHQRLVLGVGSAEAALLKVDEAGSVIESRRGSLVSVSNYSPYGHTLSPPDVGFKGEWFNRFSRSYPLGNGYRDYSTIIMRFLSPDSLSPMGKGGINPYAFVSNDPMNWSDPSGHIRTIYKGGGSGFFEFKKGIFNKKRELIIHAHGDRGTLYFEDVEMNVRELYSKAVEKGVKFTRQKNGKMVSRYDRVHIAVCHTADVGYRGESPYAQQFADLSGLPTKGYKGLVAVNQARGKFMHVYTGAHPRLDQQKFNYQPVVFVPRTLEEHVAIRDS